MRIYLSLATLLLLLPGCMGDVGAPGAGGAPSAINDKPKFDRKIAVAVIEDTFARTATSPQTDFPFWQGLGKRGIEWQLIDSTNERAKRFQKQVSREGLPAIVIYENPSGSDRGEVLYSGKCPDTTAGIDAAISSATNKGGWLW